MLRSIGKSQSRKKERERLQWKGLAEKEGFSLSLE